MIDTTLVLVDETYNKLMVSSHLLADGKSFVIEVGMRDEGRIILILPASKVMDFGNAITDEIQKCYRAIEDHKEQEYVTSPPEPEYMPDKHIDVEYEDREGGEVDNGE